MTSILNLDLPAALCGITSPAPGLGDPAGARQELLVRLAEEVNAAMQADNPPGAFVWKHNALRHSRISYRVAKIQSVDQVALEAGNSPQMAFSNYRELVRPVDAEKWFGITPDTQSVRLGF